jgi:hypothetical protein
VKWNLQFSQYNDQAGCMTAELGFDTCQGQRFLFSSKLSMPALGPCSRRQQVRGGRVLWRHGDSAKTENMWGTAQSKKGGSSATILTEVFLFIPIFCKRIAIT